MSSQFGYSILFRLFGSGIQIFLGFDFSGLQLVEWYETYPKPMVQAKLYESSSVSK